MTEFKWKLLGAMSSLTHREMPLRPGTESQLTFTSTAGEAVFPIPKERLAELSEAMRQGEDDPIFELELILRKRGEQSPDLVDRVFALDQLLAVLERRLNYEAFDYDTAVPALTSVIQGLEKELDAAGTKSLSSIRSQHNLDKSGIPNTDDHPLHCPCRRCESG